MELNGMSKKILLTGCYGFIGFHTVRRLVEAGHHVYGIDDMYAANDRITSELKENRKKILATFHEFEFVLSSLDNLSELEDVFENADIDYVIHLAAQAGVRAPPSGAVRYIQSNLLGFGNVIVCCEKYNVKHFVYASSSSVYGENSTTPFKESEVLGPVKSLYAATKRSNELIAQAYASSYSVSSTGLRFFTVYGPWSRPDMAVFTFARKMVDGEEIQLYGGGELLRDFTYIGDVVDSIEKLLLNVEDLNLGIDPPSNHRILNVGLGNPRSVNELVSILEKHLGLRAKTVDIEQPLQDVVVTHADSRNLAKIIGSAPETTLETGIEKFCEWFADYYIAG